jgi:ribosome-binding protein aMBF1 (putative translation factor)
MNNHRLAQTVAAVHAARMIAGPHILAARALLGWSAAELAEKARLSYPTVQRAESAQGIPSMKTTNLFAIQRALEIAGIVFSTDGDNGVKMKRPS